MSEKPIIRHADDVTPVNCLCGQSTRIITKKDTPKLNVHRTEITDSQCHYHKNATEVYYILEGSGTMILDDEQVDLHPGLCIYIPPTVRHQVKGHICTLIIGVPAFDEEDEYTD
jgi:mannose-6-phosphate isomerase-like protein (cupin superfamily)